MTPSVTSTVRALRPSGGLNAPTASLTASMPVSDAPPLANALQQREDHDPLIDPVGAGARHRG